jgi:adenylate cyclase, class 2
LFRGHAAHLNAAPVACEAAPELCSPDRDIEYIGHSMSGPLEREIKLRIDSADSARASVLDAGGTLIRERRLQSDALLDDSAGTLRTTRCALRVRVEPRGCFLTFKGPPQPSLMKLREELETSIGDAETVFAMFERLGYRVWFRYEKYREEFALDDVVVAIDETPVGAFLEIEGTDAGIQRASTRLGREPRDYIVDSYRSLFVQFCAARGVDPGDMVFVR